MSEEFSMFYGFPFALAVLLLFAIGIVFMSLRVLREYERGVVFLLGRFWRVKGPGLVVIIPGVQQMVRAIARQAEAERERRAKVIHAEGEKQAAQALLEAAQMLARQPEAMQLRYLQTMTQVAGDRGSTIVFPLPLDLLKAFTSSASGSRG